MAFDEVSSPVLAKTFSAPDFDPNEYVKGVIAKCDIYRTLYDQRNNIKKLGEETAVSLKKNVYRNYRQFIDTAKEISYLEAEMYQLSHLLTEQKSILADQIETDIFERPKGLPIKKNPELEAYKTKKKNFLDNIKVSKQMLGELSVKELLLDGDLTEFDPETYSPIQRIGAFLLTDNLLITTLPGSGKCSILTMFDLSDLAVVNVRDGQGVKNAFKVLYSLDTRMFGAPSKDLKLSWLDQIERAKKNYRKGAHIDSQKLTQLKAKEEEEEESEDVENVETTEIQISKDMEKGLEAEVSNRYPDFLNVDWLIELPEDLDMCIAQRDFEGAVQLVEKARSYLVDFPESSSLKDIRNKIESRVQQLVGTLEKSLDNSSSSRHVSLRSIRVYVLLLIRLRRDKLSCELFLRNRGYEIKNSFKQLKMEGATAIYIEKLANVFFTAIIETGKEYKKNFPANENCSAFVVWVHNELQHFADKFSRQVYTRNCSLSAIAVCINITLAGCKRMESIGIDLMFDLQHMFLKDVMSSMFDARDQLLERSKLRAMEDTWAEVSFADDPDGIVALSNEMESLGVVNFDSFVEGSIVKLSSSILSFAKSVLSFFVDGMILYTSELHDVLVQCFSEIFKAQAIQIGALLQEQALADKVPFILANVTFVQENLLQIVLSGLEVVVGHTVAPLQAEEERIDKLRKFAGKRK